MNPIKFFTTPEYLFRPRQALIRLKRALLKPRGEWDWVTLPWGARIRVRPREVIGANIWYYGIFDLIVAEAIARLTEAAETALDIGANIGQMTTLMSLRVGPRGTVHAVEPHPEVFAELQQNLEGWAGQGGRGPVQTHPLALSNQVGQGHLLLHAHWQDNRGTGRVAEESAPAGANRIAIPLTTLDVLLGADRRVGVCKIDVEGHERQVLEGAPTLLRQGRIRDIIFEDLAPFPSPVHQMLLDYGYTLFLLRTRLSRPLLESAAAGAGRAAPRDGLNYLATRHPNRARDRFQAAGWRALSRTSR